MSMAGISGIYAATVTPVDDSGAISIERFARHGRWLLRHGCHGLGLFAVTGEAASFAVVDAPAMLYRRGVESSLTQVHDRRQLDFERQRTLQAEETRRQIEEQRLFEEWQRERNASSSS